MSVYGRKNHLLYLFSFLCRAFLVKNGYRVKKIQPVDRFPHTEHEGCVVSLTRK